MDTSIVNIVDMIPWVLVTGLVPLVMLILPFAKKKINERTLHIMLGLSAGILLGICFFDIIPEAYKIGGASTVGLGVGLGFFTLLLIEKHLIGAGGNEAGHHFAGDAKIQPFGTLAMAGLVVHGFIDGFVIPLSFSAGNVLGTIVGLGVALHQIPDSFVAASISLSAGFSKKKTFGSVFLTALDTPIGILAGLLLLSQGSWFIPLGIAFSAGTFIFVAAADLIPELQHHEQSRTVTISIMAGFVLLGLLTYFFPL